MAYDQAITVFSPDGHLLQVEYAAEAVKKGLNAIGIKGKDCIVLGAEKRATHKLKDTSTKQKLLQLDNSIVMTFAGLQADSRVLANRGRIECQSYRLNMGDSPPIDYIARYIAKLQQQFTIRGGMRPFGLSALIGGFNSSGEPELYQTEPHGILLAMKAQAIGKSQRTMCEFLEKHFKDDMSEQEAIELAAQSLLEVVENGNESMNIVVLRKVPGRGGADCAEYVTVSPEDIEEICNKYTA
eukprot:GHVH01011098.1.p1 GENE.GHVH01011098.1~~GHVH01011098.1.p1  ORF type:complete len:241 (-),score=29.63 GHVH01011098.1:60-782(-)